MFQRDTFTDTAGTDLASHYGELGGIYGRNGAFSSGSLAITNANRLRANASASVYFGIGLPANADYEVEADVTMLSNAGDYIGLAGRVDPTNFNGYFWLYSLAAGGQYQLLRSDSVAGVSTIATANATWTSGTKRLKLSMVGSTIKGEVDGVVVCSGTDSVVTAKGFPGVIAVGAVTNTTGQHLDNLSARNYASQVDVLPSDAGLFWSPYNWVQLDGAAVTTNPGAYLKTNFTGTSCRLTVDCSTMAFNSVGSGRYPRLRYSVDGGAATTVQLSATTAEVVIATGLAAGTHSLRLDVVSCDGVGNDRWNTPIMAVRIGGLVLDTGCSVFLPAVESNRMLAFGDSITEAGWSQLAPGADDSTYPHYSVGQDATVSYAKLIADARGCEFGIAAFGGQAWNASVSGSNVPAFPSAWDKCSAGRSRLSGGLLSPAPDIITLNMGTNGGLASGTPVATWLTDTRAAAGPDCRIYVIVPFNGSQRTNLTSGFNSYVAANPSDSNVFLIDLGSPSYTTTDTVHPDTDGHDALATLLLAEIPDLTTPLAIDPVATTNASDARVVDLDSQVTGGTTPRTHSWFDAIGGQGLTFTSPTNQFAHVTVPAAGTYTVRCSVTDSDGTNVVQDLTFTVNQAHTTTTLSPSSVSVLISTTKAFTASALDQFGTALTSQPTFTYSKTGSIGTINSATGVLTAAGSPATGTVQGTANGKAGTASVTVVASINAARQTISLSRSRLGL